MNSGPEIEPELPTRGFVRRGMLAGLLGAGAVAGSAALTAVSAAPAHAAPDPGRTRFVNKSVVPVNVRDHGAIGDGATDDAAALQAAVDEAKVAGRPVYLPAGRYLVSGPVHLTSPTSLLGDGMWQTTVVRASSAPILDFPSGTVRSLDLADLCFDGDGQASNVVTVEGTSVHELRVRSCRFTNLVQGERVNPPAYKHAAFELRGVDHTEVVDCLFHNPAKYAGYGMAIVVQPKYDAGRIVLTGSNRFLWLNHAMRVNSGDARKQGHDTSTEMVHIDGAQFDAYWWLLPAQWSGGAGATYTAAGLSDPKADFTDVPAGTYPNTIYVRALPVRHRGAVTAASHRRIDQTGVDFTAMNLKRGELVRADGKFAVIEGLPRNSKDALLVEEWLDNETLRPTNPPQPGEAYTVHGIVLGQVITTTKTTLGFEGGGAGVKNWFDLHGADVTPENGTPYEVMQSRPGYHVLLSTGVQTARVMNSTFRRSHHDQLSGGAKSWQVIGNHFIDGQDVGFSSEGVGEPDEESSQHIVIGNRFVHQGSRGFHLTGDHSIATDNRTESAGWRHYGVGNGHYVLRGCRYGYFGHNVAIGGTESVQKNPGFLLGQPSRIMVSDTNEHNTLEQNVFHDLDAADYAIWGEKVLGNEIYGASSFEFLPGGSAQHVYTSGYGSPEAKLAALPGSTYHRRDAEPDAGFYVKESGDGDTGWVAK